MLVAIQEKGRITVRNTEIAVLGAGLAGIATAYYLCTKYQKTSLVLIDCRPPMSFTSAQSGDNYRNWWPHPCMTEFTNHSIDLIEQIARDSSNVINMNRRGYLLATRDRNIDEIVAGLQVGYEHSDPDSIRIHDNPEATSYEAAISSDWESAPRGVDVLSSQQLIRENFPSLSSDIRNIVHIRRAGDIGGQQLGQYMLEKIKAASGSRLSANVRNIERGRQFHVDLAAADKDVRINADVIVNAAGPFAADLAAMIDVNIPIENFYQQKIAFDDTRGAIPRRLPFCCDLDDFELDWTAEDRSLLAEDADTAWLTGVLPGGAHCRPEGGDRGSWVKLGWAYNRDASNAQQDLANEPRKNSHYPEIVMRAAARLNPSLQAYVDHFPGKFIHYGGYYTMTRENWPLVGPLGVEGAFVTGALSGFGSMSACAAGATCAAWITGDELPGYATQFSLARYDDSELMAGLAQAGSRGIL